MSHLGDLVSDYWKQFGPDPVDRGNMDNYALFTAGGVDWLVLSLEFEAPTYALDWADRVLAAYPNRTVILATHSFLNLANSRNTNPERPGGTAPAVMWDQFVRTHCQIRLVVSGHVHDNDLGEARRTDKNACGNDVHQLTTDYQDRANGGNGWLRYYRFDPAAATLTATTYSPTLGQYETDDSSSFTLPFDLVGQVPAPFQTIATVTVPSGQTASTTWAGLARDTEYEWRAVVSDGTSTTESPTWRLRTPYDPVVVRDEFNRTQTSGWGSTDTGQAWVLNNLNRLSVNGSAGVLVVDVGRRYEGMLDTSAGDVSVLTSIATTATATGSGTYVSAVQRKSSTQLYTAKVQYSSTGAPRLTLVRQVGSTETTLASLRLGTTPAANQMLHLRFEAEGTSPVRLRARTWTGATEPTAWTLTASDATVGFQTPTVGVGISAYVSSTATAAATVLVDRLEVSRLAPPPNRAPSAGLTSSVTGLTVTADARTSTDPDGDALTYAWAFGDGATATGATTSHTYAAAGTYPMVLTVTDSRGATNQVSVPVTVAPAPNAVTPRPTEDVERDRTARAQDRQRSLEARAQRRADEARDVALRAEQAFETLPPGGEPIKVGHHSEHRHRRALERADEATRRSIEADREAEHAAQRAATARSSQAARYSPLTVA
ncbi:PKD domain-containing protein, partial [Miniimonas arenae]|uniref:PKD domain-containing protein n=1 Tax=Miniimonas arenae TaxID=676201 RepID=UPI0015D63A84